MLSTSALSFDEHLYSTDQNLSVESDLRKAKIKVPGWARNRPTTWGTTAMIFGAILAIYLGLLVMIYVCSRYRVKGLDLEPRGRRLAGGNNDDIELPPTRDLDNICSTLGLWVPAEIPPGGPSSLVNLVYEDLKETQLEKGTGPAAGPPEKRTISESVQEVERGSFVPGLTTQPPSGFERGSAEVEPGLSLKVAEVSTVLQPAFSGAHGGLTLPSFATAFGTLAASKQQGCGVSTGLLPVIGDAPSTSTATLPLSQVPVHSGHAIHPFVHLPVVEPGVVPRPWRSSDALVAMARSRCSHMLLHDIRELLLRPSLDFVGVSALMAAAEGLVAYTVQRMAPPTVTLSPAEYVRNWGRRFLVLNAAHSATRVVGTGVPPWWQYCVFTLLKDLESRPLKETRRCSANNRVAAHLFHALMMYKRGSAPSDNDVILIKRALFCKKSAPACFRTSEWNAWREDDKNFSAQAP